MCMCHTHTHIHPYALLWNERGRKFTLLLQGKIYYLVLLYIVGELLWKCLSQGPTNVERREGELPGMMISWERC